MNDAGHDADTPKPTKPDPEVLDPGIRYVIDLLWEKGYVTVFSCSGLYGEHKDRLTSVDADGRTIRHGLHTNVLFGPCTEEQERRLWRAARLTFGAYVKDPRHNLGNPAVMWYFGFRDPLRFIPVGRPRDRAVKLQLYLFSLLV